MPAPDPDFRPTRYSRWNPDGRGRFTPPEREVPRATRTQSAIETVLFIVFGALIVLAAIAVYTMFAPSHRKVPNRVAQGFAQDRINILVFGFGGDAHPTRDQGADSIMLISLKPSTRQVAVVSVPRDLWVPIGRFGTHRITYAHEAGQLSGYPGDGTGLLCDTVSRVFNQPIHAYVRADFAGFEKLIDDIGGVDVDCQRSFYDFLFRDGFTRGWHHLDGRRALQYVRYRYVLGPEGDNYARELRQQQVFSAVRQKLQQMSPQTAARLMRAVSGLSASTQTNLTFAQMLTLYRLFHNVPPSNVRHVSLKPITDLFEVTRPTETGTAVRTRTGDNRELQALEKNVFAGRGEFSTPDEIRFAATH